MLDGAFNRLSPLAHARHSATREFVDVDDGVIRHAGLHLASAMVVAHHRLALDVCYFGDIASFGDGLDGAQIAGVAADTKAPRA